MLSSFQIVDHILEETKVVQAQGFLEAISEYLSSSLVNVSIDWNPAFGRAEIVDRRTKNNYTVTLL
ncbi:hypothetical protein [Vibrio sp. R78045]|uniref:hypothetical protein n=1 Tax=Vibrio sp. R78045 TaxID=3093868 RepID=UPI0036F39305